MIKIISIHDTFKHYREPIEEFIKRLWKEVSLIKLKPSKKKEASEIVREESRELKKTLDKLSWYKILLDIGSKTISTDDFYKLVEDKKMSYGDIVFIIGWAYGIEESIISEQINHKLSFSPMTFPHSQALMMLLEQVYRVSCIKKGIKYHH